MTKDVARYVKACLACRRIKAYRDGKHGLLKPLPLPKRYFQDISVDFIVELFVCILNGRKYQHIMVIVDRLSKKKRFIAMNSLEIEAVVQAFIDWIWREEDYSDTIVSDRGSQWISHFWKRLCERIEIKPKLSTAWHSETDDQTERANTDLKTYLRAYVNFNQDDWVLMLLIAEFEANSVKSASTELEPFMAIKGYLPRSGLGPDAPAAIAGDSTQRREMRSADKVIAKLEQLRGYLRDELAWARAKMEHYANVQRHPAPEFRVGDMVMLDARHMRTSRLSQSLDYKNLGPFRITKVIDNCAYKLELPDSMKIHPVFHPWLLHLYNGNPLPGQVQSDSAPVVIDGEDEWDVTEIVNSRIDKRMNDALTGASEGCLVYKVIWTSTGPNDTNARTNATPKWYRFTNLEHFPYLIADFHHRYSDKPGPHASYVRPEDWTSSGDNETVEDRPGQAVGTS